MDIGSIPSASSPAPSFKGAPAHGDPPRTSILPDILAATHAVRILTGLRLAPLGISSGQDRMMIALLAQGRISVSALAEHLGVRPSTVSKMADRLTARGYLVRLGDETDARRTSLQLTEAGEAMTRKVIDLCDRIDRELTTSLSPTQISMIHEGVATLNAAVNHRIRKLR